MILLPRRFGDKRRRIPPTPGDARVRVGGARSGFASAGVGTRTLET